MSPEGRDFSKSASRLGAGTSGKYDAARFSRGVVLALALALAAASSALPVRAGEMSCRPGATCAEDVRGLSRFLEPVAWFKGLCPRVKADPQRLPCAGAVGRTETQSGTGWAELGSGFVFLHTRELVTSSHGIKSDVRIRVRFRVLAGEFRAYGTVVKRGGYYAQGNAGRIQNVAEDWAVVVLDRAVPGVRPLEAFPGDLDDARKLGGQLSLVGFDARDQGLYVCGACAITGVTEFGLVEHGCGASKGTSGGPLMTVSPHGACEVVAMQVVEDPRARDGDALDAANANKAVSAQTFIADARRVRDLLGRGLSAIQIKKTIGR